MNTEEQFRKRITELGTMSFMKDMVMFSDFLDLYQQSVVRSISWKNTGVHVEFNGGHEFSERRMAAFIPDTLYYEWDYPFSCLEIRPLNPKYAEKLNHRDFMGSILSLGVDRSRIGDIIVKNSQAWFFCHDQLIDFFMNELHMIRHTEVSVRISSADPEDVRPDMKEISGSIASLRLDSIIALAFGVSRSSISALIPKGGVQVNARPVTSAAFQISPGDVISVRGCGKCRFEGSLKTTKKGRSIVRLYKYI